jgi:uncharacterized protein (TIRG00374 family)
VAEERPPTDQRPPSVVGIPVAVIRWGLVIFAAASVVGFFIAFLISEDWDRNLNSLRHFNPVWFIPAAGLMLLDWLGGGLRFKALIGPHEGRASLLECVQIGTASTAMGYITPSATGSGPTNLYGMMRRGLSLGRAAAVNAASFMSNVIFLSSAGLIAWALGFSGKAADIRLPIADLSAAALFRWTAWVFAGTAALIVLLALLPDIARGVIRRWMGTDHPRVEKVLQHFDELHAGLSAYWRHGWLQFLLAILSGTFQFGSRFLLGYVVLKGFVIDPPFIEVLLVHIVLQYLLFVMPIPGGAGVVEVLCAVLMSPFLPPGLVVPYTVVWRIFLTYGTVAAGGSMIMSWLAADGAR